MLQTTRKNDQPLLSPIKEIEARVKKDKDCISLSQGALRVGGIPIEIKRHLQDVLNTDKTDYYQSAWGIMPLREKIAAVLSKKNSVTLSYKNVLVTHGCAGAISTLLLTLLQKGDEIILPEPTYPAYKNVADLVRAKTVFVSSYKDESFDTEAIKRARTEKTKMIIFSNPCNPNGFIVLEEKLRALASWCEENRIYLIVDESYDDYIFEGDLFSATSLVPSHQYVIRAGSYSKSLSMSGWRVGFMVVPQSLGCRLGTVQDSLLNCPNVIAQHAVLYALDHPYFAQKFHDIVKKNRDEAVALLQPLADRHILSFSKPAAGFYLFLETNVKDDFGFCLDLLKNAGVGLVPGSAFGPSGKSFIRLCYARQPDVLREGIQRLVNYVQKK